MADSVSSIITIASVSLKAVKETHRYIQEISVINDLIKSLLVKLNDLHKLIKVVESTWLRAGPDDDSPSSVFVGKTLVACQKRLAQVKLMVSTLASRDSDTWLEKLALKRRSDNAKKGIELAICDIQTYMEHIRTGISCWSLDVASAHRRISHAMAMQNLNVNTNLQRVVDQEISPLSRTLSDADTLLSRDNIIGSRRSSAATSRSRPSVSSTNSPLLQSRSTDTCSVTSGSAPSVTPSDGGWANFHYKVTKCEGKPSRIEAIRKTLLQSEASGRLATSTDGLLRTPLHLAAQRGDVEVAKVLVAFSADINAKDSEPSTVLDLAIANNQRNFVSFLIGRRVDETAILPRNAPKLAEMKRIINFSRTVAQNTAKDVYVPSQPLGLGLVST